MRERSKQIGLAGVLLVVSLASASAQQPPDPEYTLKLKQAQVNAIVNVFTTAPLPWKDSNPILQDIVKQVQEQDAERAKEAKGEKPYPLLPDKPKEK